jgi:methyl-accepting chemotaxis protein
MKIGVKLGMGFGFVLLLLVAVGVLAQVELRLVDSGYQDKVLTAMEGKAQCQEVVEHVIQARRLGQAFLWRKQLSDVEQATHHLDVAEQLVQAVGKGAAQNGNTVGVDVLNRLQTAISGYRDNFAKVVELTRIQGLTPDEGLRGGLHKAARALEADFKKARMIQAEATYYSMRREEKDYLLRRDKEHVEGVQELGKELRNALEFSLLPFEQKENLYAQLDAYTEQFLRLVELDGQIEKSIEGAVMHAGQASELALEIEEIAQSDAEKFKAWIQKSAATATLVIWGAIVFSVLAAAVFVFFFSRSITRPLGRAVAMFGAMKNGDFSDRLGLRSRDEIGQMGRAMDDLSENVERHLISSLQRIANGDLSFDMYVAGPKDALGGAMKSMLEDLNELLRQVHTAAEQIASGSAQVSDSSQSLSQGATQSASSLEEITSSMAQMASQTRHNAENATQTSTLAGEAREAARKGNARMKQMVTAMGEINDAGQSISKIIKVIDEIAFQTNLLALNAAVEAARAGQHGKGFAVVAEEVRNLAARSAKAASETAELIEGSVKKAENGADIADRTAEALEQIVSGITRATDLAVEIAAASNEQAQGIGQVNQGLGQIDQVTQQNTANAEESAAAAEELSGQADELRRLLGRFRLKGGAGQSALYASRASLRGETEAADPALSSQQESGAGWGDNGSVPAASDGMVKPEEVIALDDEEFGKY